MSQAFDFGHLVDLCRRTHEESQRSAARAMDTHLVMRNWLFGWYIVEFEEGGVDRSRLYGKKLIVRLSDELKASGLKGCSPTNLRKFREFYRAYPEIQQALSVESIVKLPPGKRQTASVESLLTSPGIASVLSAAMGERFSPGWSHYVTLLTIDNADAHRFYEIEAAQNQWSVRELKRQIASSLYERLALSGTDPAARRQYLRIEIPTLSAIETRTCSPTGKHPERTWRASGFHNRWIRSAGHLKKWGWHGHSNTSQ